MFYQKKNNVLEPLTGSTLYAETPIGTVIASFLAVAPSGYIKADGTVYTKAQYPELYERIPDVFKDTTNETFTIDLREVALKGIGLSSLTTEHYSSTGLTLGEFIEDRLQNHRHQVNYSNNNSTTGSNATFKYPTTAATSTTTHGVVEGRIGNTTEVKSVGVNYFVKAKHVALPIDIMDAISEEYATKEDAHPSYLDTFEFLISGTGGNTSPEVTETVVTPGIYAMSCYTYATGQGNSNCWIQINGKTLFSAVRYAAYEYAFCQATLYLHAGDTVTLGSAAAPFNNSSYFFCKRIA